MFEVDRFWREKHYKTTKADKEQLAELMQEMDYNEYLLIKHIEDEETIKINENVSKVVDIFFDAICAVGGFERKEIAAIVMKKMKEHGMKIVNEENNQDG